MARPTLLSLAVFIAACRSSPPPSTAGITTRAGAARVLHSGSSGYYDASTSDCRGRRILNTRFERLSVPGIGYLVVQEVDDVTSRDCAEGSTGTIAVTVWEEGSPDRPLATFERQGSEGAVAIPDGYYRASRFAPLHRSTEFGCCGALDVHAYTNLTTGAPAFSSTVPVLSFFANGTVRYVAILTQQAVAPVSEALWSPRTAAVVQYGTGVGPPQMQSIPGDSGVVYFADQPRLAGPHGSFPDSAVTLAVPCCDRKDTVAVSGVSLVVRLEPQGDSSPIQATLRIAGDHLEPAVVTRPRR